MIEYSKITAPKTEFLKLNYSKEDSSISYKWGYGKIVECSNGREIGIEKDGGITDIATGASININNLSWYLMHNNFIALEEICNNFKSKAKLA